VLLDRPVGVDETDVQGVRELGETPAYRATGRGDLAGGFGQPDGTAPISYLRFRLFHVDRGEPSLDPVGK
jgi:hypothetical protein